MATSGQQHAYVKLFRAIVHPRQFNARARVAHRVVTIISFAARAETQGPFKRAIRPESEDRGATAACRYFPPRREGAPLCIARQNSGPPPSSACAPAARARKGPGRCRPRLRLWQGDRQKGRIGSRPNNPERRFPCQTHPLASNARPVPVLHGACHRRARTLWLSSARG